MALSSDDQFDRDLALALQMSIQDQEAASHDVTAVLDKEYSREVCVSAPTTAATGDARGGADDARVLTGRIVQYNTLDQFHRPTFGALIDAHHSPQSICGAFAMAHSILIPRLLGGAVAAHAEAHGPAAATKPLDVSALQLEKLLFTTPADGRGAGDTVVTGADGARRGVVGRHHAPASNGRGLRDPALLHPEIERALEWLHTTRAAYIAAHAGDFKSRSEKDAYLKAWVANYEISDYLRTVAAREVFGARGSGGKAAVPAAAPAVELCFARYNQFPEIKTATHEERGRIAAEERRFGGRWDDANKRVMYERARGDVKFWIDVVAPSFSGGPHEPFVRRPLGVCNAEWRGHAMSSTARRHLLLGPSFYAVDLNGHFVYALALVVDGTRTLVVLNSTLGAYLESEALDNVFACAFGPQAAV